MITPGPIFQEQMRRFGRVWKQGEHVVITGPTGGGKTTLARSVVDQRLQRHGFVVVMVCKLREDKTITDEYVNWIRWKQWKKRPRMYENRILLWPDTKTLGARNALAHQKEIFSEALDDISKSGKWTLQIDEGLYTASPSYLNMGHEMGMLHALGRSSNLTVLTLAQRASHLPVVVWSSASHAFIGRTRELADVRRLSNLDGKEGSKELSKIISNQGRRDFTWLPIAPDWDYESVNVRR